MATFLPCLVPTTAIGIDIIQGLQTPRVTSACANCTQRPAHLAQHRDVCQRTQKPKSHWEKTPVSKQKFLLSPVPGFCQDGSSEGSAQGCRAQGSPSSHSPAQAPMPCRESQEPWVGPEEGDEAVSLQQHAQERPPHEDDEDPPHEEAGALQLWPLEKESEGPPEADDEDQAGEEEDLGG